MSKIMLTGVDGNLGSEAAKVLMKLEDKDNLIFSGYNPEALKPYEELGIETRTINLNDPEDLEGKFEKNAKEPTKTRSTRQRKPVSNRSFILLWSTQTTKPTRA